MSKKFLDPHLMLFRPKFGPKFGFQLIATLIYPCALTKIGLNFSFLVMMKMRIPLVLTRLSVIVERIVSKYKRRKVMMAKSRVLRRKSSEQKRNILTRHPDIGKVMEKYAKDCDSGADRWRRLGTVTFGGDQKKEKRLTYRRLQQYLETQW